LSEALHTRPSEIADLENSYDAYCFDQAVATWGIFVQSELDKIEGKTSASIQRKRESKLRQLLAEPGQKQVYADPADLFKEGGEMTSGRSLRSGNGKGHDRD
jgi:hypothetical protein